MPLELTKEEAVRSRAIDLACSLLATKPHMPINNYEVIDLARRIADFICPPPPPDAKDSNV